MIKLIATDMDGTLLHDDKTYSPELNTVYHKLKAQDILFVIASGNQYDLLLSKFDDEIKNDLVYLCENGTKVVYQGECLYSSFLEKEDYQQTLAVLKQYDDCMIVVSGNQHAYISKKYEYKRDFIELFMKNVVFVDSYDEIQDDILKFSIAHFGNEIDRRKKQIASELNECMKLVTTDHVWFDIFYKTVNKGTTLTHLGKYFDIDLSEMAAFGDEMNDYEMLQQVKYAYAMANAADAIKAIAYEVVASNEDDGVIKKIKEIIDHQY